MNKNRNNKKILLSGALFLSVFFIQAQQATKRIQFNNAGEFKIAQFTGMHLNRDTTEAGIVFNMIKQVVDSEKPDLVIFTGDNTTTNEVELAWKQIAEMLSETETPWTAVLGNHDDEYDVKRNEIINIIQKQPFCVLDNVAENIKGEGNHVLPVYDASGEKTQAILYCFDSNAYSEIPHVKGYGWFNNSQIDWYAEQSQHFRKQNDDFPLPALAFFHIPLPEYQTAWESFDTKRYGDRNERECPPLINSGMFTKMLECGDIMGTFVGHDHVNDYVATLHGIALGYGRASGGENTYGDKTPGSRIIVLKAGERRFDSYIREKIGRASRRERVSPPV